TDVGKVQSGLPVTISVDAFPHRTFDGTVLKIEAQAQVSQNVTMFPVEVNIPNPEHLLKPGMNTEVEIHIGQRQGVLAVPNAALRTPKDVASAASVLGLDSLTVARQLAAPAVAPSASVDALRTAASCTPRRCGGAGGTAATRCRRRSRPPAPATLCSRCAAARSCPCRSALASPIRTTSRSRKAWRRRTPCCCSRAGLRGSDAAGLDRQGRARV